MTKKIVAAIAALTFSAASFAQSTATTNAAGTASANGGVNVFAPNETSTVRYATSSAFAPPLAATEPCMGSTSMGATAMSWGVSLGKTWTDDECELIKKANTLWQADQHLAAIAQLCSDDDMRYDISVAGGIMDKRADGAVIRIGCPMTRQEWIAAGHPLIDPETGLSVASGTVVIAAPPPKPVTVSSVDALGVKETITSQPRL